MTALERFANPHRNDSSDGGFSDAMLSRLAAVVTAPFYPLLPLLLQSENTVALVLRLLDVDDWEEDDALALCYDDGACDVDEVEVQDMSKTFANSAKEEDEGKF